MTRKRVRRLVAGAVGVLIVAGLVGCVSDSELVDDDAVVIGGDTASSDGGHSGTDTGRTVDSDGLPPTDVSTRRDSSSTQSDTGGGKSDTGQTTKPGKPGTFYAKSMNVQGNTRYYGYHVPSSYSGSKAWPMFIFLHGADNRTDPKQNQQANLQYTRLKQNADQNGYIVVSPTAPKMAYGGGMVLSWKKNRSVSDAFIMQIIKRLKSRYRIDSKRIYVAGFSSGGYYSVHLAMNYSQTFAAFAVHGAGLGSRDDFPSGAKRKIPGFLRIGADDTMRVPQLQDLRDRMKSAGWPASDIDYKELSGVGHSYDASKVNAQQWSFLSARSLP